MDVIKNPVETQEDDPVFDALLDVLHETRKEKVGAPKLRRFTREEYYKMAEVGIIEPGERVELIAGVIVNMAALGNWHIFTVRILNEEIVLQLQRRAQVDVQGAVVFDDGEPQPDLLVIKAGLPGKAEARDVLLVIEVSDTTLRDDQRVKAVLYAQKGIPEYWIVDRQGDQIIQYTEPKNAKYTKSRHWKRGETITSTVPPIITLDVTTVLGNTPVSDAEQP
jgi:Uma2 family endonuclease